MGGIVLNARDISERKELEDRLAHQAFHDPLTGLANRALFVDRLGHALERAKRQDELLAVMFVDLDGFKVVNDSLGHEVGDRLLVTVGERLRAYSRATDTVARLGGDEFTLLLEDVIDVDGAARVAERIQNQLRVPVELDGHEVVVSASVGIALTAPGQHAADDLLRNADIALYRAKNRGKDRYEVFDTSMHEGALERLKLESDLRHAVERDEFRVYYQPKVLLKSGGIIGFEALVRWEHPERGLVSPAEFIPVAGETGLIVPIGRWVLERACRQVAGWAAESPGRSPRGTNLAVSVNLSARQFQQKNLAHDVRRILEETGLSPGSLILEITEGVVMDDAPLTSKVMSELKDLGVRLSIDDFGTGYSSLSYLKRFPADFLKIDRSFVDGLGRDPESEAIVSAMIGLSRDLGLEVVAEGIEDAHQLELLNRMGCELGQGYYFAKPLPPEEAVALLIAPSAL